MQGNRQRDTKPELAVRRAAFALGLRYRVGRRPLPERRRTADLVFSRVKVAVFVDGCFWHGCAAHGSRPTKHVEYWQSKLATNRARDVDTDDFLRAAGWIPLRFWAHDDAKLVAAQIAQVVGSRRATSRGRAPGR